MSLRKKFIAYLIFLHLVFAGVMVSLLWEHRLWLIGVELFFVISLVIAVRLFRSLFQPLELLAMGVDVMKDEDFSTRLRTIGQPEMDSLINVYNRMADHLRQERIRLQEQQYFLEKVLFASPAGIITLDYDGRITEVNPAAGHMLLLRPDELKGRTLSESRSHFLETLSGLRDGESAVLTLSGIRKVKCHRSSFIDRGFSRSFFVIEELTEELRKTEKAAYEKLIRMLSHEVNNSIGAANSLLHSCLHYKEQLREEDRIDFETAISVAISRTEHLNSFMKSFADIVRLPLPRKEWTDLKALVEDTAKVLSVEFSRRNIALVWDLEHLPGQVFLDKHQIEQALLNILKNAMEAIKSDGTVTIRFKQTGSRNTLIIEDTGSGIGSDARQHLFTPFYSTKEKGQGIGLTLVQEILAHHKFEFSLDSAPGEPTRFTMYFG